MIFVDTNIPMYLIGQHHPSKTDAIRLTEQLVTAHEKLVTDTEVLQEILQRYVAIHRRDAIQPAFDAILHIVDEVLPIRRGDVLRAREIVLGSETMGARDAIHLAVMERNGIGTILSFDSHFDGFPGIRRIHH